MVSAAHQPIDRDSHAVLPLAFALEHLQELHDQCTADSYAGGQSAQLPSQAVNSGISGRQLNSLGQHSSSAGQLSAAAGQQRMRSSLNPAAPGFQSMRPPMANGLHPGPPKQQATGETGF